MRYYITTDIDLELREMVEQARRAEDIGFEAIFSTHYYSSPFVPLASMAEHTKEINLGTNIALAFTRSPFETAMTALDLDALSNGRFILGLAPSFKAINERWHGVTFGKPAPHLKECIQVIRQVMQKGPLGERIQFQGDYYNIDIQGWQRPQKQPREHIPIYVGAIQEGMCRMAGEVADGILPHTICTGRWMKGVMEPNLAIGLKRGGKERKGFDLAAAVTVGITKDKAQAIEDFKGHVAFSAVTKPYQRIFAWHGFEKEAVKIREIFMERGYGREVLEATPPEMVEAFSYIGTIDEVKKQVQALEEVADSVYFMSPGYHLEWEKR